MNLQFIIAKIFSRAVSSFFLFIPSFLFISLGSNSLSCAAKMHTCIKDEVSSFVVLSFQLIYILALISTFFFFFVLPICCFFPSMVSCLSTLQPHLILFLLVRAFCAIFIFMHLEGTPYYYFTSFSF